MGTKQGAARPGPATPKRRARALALAVATLLSTVAVPHAAASAVPSPAPSPGLGAEQDAQTDPSADPSLDPSVDPTPGPDKSPVAPSGNSTVGGPLLARRGLITPAGVKPPPKTEASAYVIADADTGAVLAAKDPHGYYRPASTLKTLTAVTLIPKLDKKRKVKPSEQACNVEGSAVGIVPQPIYTVDDLMRALLMVSGNDAALALAEANGGLKKTLADMNKEARRLQAYDTVAKTPNGLDRPGQRSSAYDLALIARAGLAMPDFRKYVSTRVAKFPAPKDDGKKKNRGRHGTPTATKSPPAYYEMANHNRLLGKYKGMIGVKNGWTSKALGSFVGAATRNGHTIIVVVMHHPGFFWDEVAKLLDWGFAARGKVKPVGRLVPPLPEHTPTPTPLVVPPGRAPAAQRPVSPPAPRGGTSPILVAGVAGGAILLAGGVGLYGIRRRRVSRTRSGEPA